MTLYIPDTSNTETRWFQGTNWDAYGGTSDVNIVKLDCIPKLEVLKEKVKSGEPITQDILNQLYVIARNLMGHKHSYIDWVWFVTGNTSPYGATAQTRITDVPVQFKNYVELGDPMLQGVVYEQWHLAPHNNARMGLDAAPLIYTRQFKPPYGKVMFYNINDTTYFPSCLQKTGIGGHFEFFYDMSDQVGKTQTLDIQVDDNALIYIDDMDFECNIGHTSFSFTPQTPRPFFCIEWCQGNSTLDTNLNPGFLSILLNGSSFRNDKVFSLSPQSSLNTTIKDARYTSFYTLYRLIRTLCNHNHEYIDFNIYNNKTWNATTHNTLLENLSTTKNASITVNTPSAQDVSYDTETHEQIVSNPYYTGDININFASPVSVP